MKKIHTKIFCFLAARGALNWMPDEPYLKMRYRAMLGEKLNLENPQKFNEKLQWLKIHNRRPEYTRMVDKYEAKQYIAELIGEQYIIPTLGVWDSFDEIDFGALPNQFVLKTTHDSGGIVICKDKSKFDFKKERRKLERHRKINYFYWGREWPYKNVKPRIMAEKYMENYSGDALLEYKFFCFDGLPKFVYVAKEIPSDPYEDFFDMGFNHLLLSIGAPSSRANIECPKNFDLMKEFSAKLSRGIPFLRVDFYEINGLLYMGELTFFHRCGLSEITPEEWNRKMGDWIQLPKK